MMGTQNNTQQLMAPWLRDLQPWLLLVCLLVMFTGGNMATDLCYNLAGQVQQCQPEFENVAARASVETSDTCGTPPEDFCVQTGATGFTKSCHVCDSMDPTKSHNASSMTDSLGSKSWWQSRSMHTGPVQFPNSVNITVRLGKTYEISYIRLRFHNSRPESFAIYRRSSPTTPWKPLQFYSASCDRTYGLQARSSLQAGQEDETTVLCSDEFSDISPLTGGNVAFSTLEGRPSAYSFDRSSALQDWVTATDVRITLNRLNTFGDEVFKLEKVLRSYFYAISDLSVGGRCKCNGHASECGRGDTGHLKCHCQHNTTGTDCERCLPFYNDRQWRRATAENANECLSCKCNGHSNRCYFDQRLHQSTGHGGHCVNCQDNTAGPFCNMCQQNFHRESQSGRCMPCNCDLLGSLGPNCDSTNQCKCKPGVGGRKCDQCLIGYHSLTEAGCRRCDCDVAGTARGCHDGSGQCFCKQNVEGNRCNRCKSGFFNLDEKNPNGCTPCFCSGHSSTCSKAAGYSVQTISSNFQTGKDGWHAHQSDGRAAPLHWSHSSQDVSVSSNNYLPVYFVAPGKFLGNQVLSYGQNLSFSFRTNHREVRLSAEDVVVEGSGLRASVPVIAQNNYYPSKETRSYTFLLHESSAYPWNPKLSSEQFRHLLSNLTAIKLRGTYSDQSTGFLDSVSLVTARPGYGPAATWVEHCVCPTAYVGQFCESCAIGYRRDPPRGGPLAACIPCSCFGPSHGCDAETGACRCDHHTAGLRCERCADGFYGNPAEGARCQQCPCPSGSSCVQKPGTQEIVCTDCPLGLSGKHCELCSDGYYGDPQGRMAGSVRPCVACDCSNNVDVNAVGNCDRSTGECLKCVHNTAGFFCDRCKEGFYGNALASVPEQKCRSCACSAFGTIGTGQTCNPVTGQCQCRPHVMGRDCGRCKLGHFMSKTGTGCTRCDCDPIGSVAGLCNAITSQCDCRPGVTGLKCDRCEKGHFGFSVTGCKPCDCDRGGSVDEQCDESGHCACQQGATGMQCDQCQENFFSDRTNPGCNNCPPCYNLVQEKVDVFRKHLKDLEDMMNKIESDPNSAVNSDFEAKLNGLSSTVSKLLNDALFTQDSQNALDKQIDELSQALASQQSRMHSIASTVGGVEGASERVQHRLSEIERLIQRGREDLEKSKKSLATVKLDGQDISGPNNFSMLAEEARILAERHKQSAKEIEKIANMAKTTSTEAYDTLNSVLKQETTLRSTLNDLSQRLEDFRKVRDDMENLTTAVQANAKAAGDRALQIYANASTSVPAVDLTELTVTGVQVKDKSLGLDQRVEQSRQALQTILTNLQPQEENARRILSRGKAEQQILDQLLARANAALNEAQKAEAQGNSTLKEAQDTLDSLEDFDSRVSANKTAAENALRSMPTIQHNINEANRLTELAERALGNAANDARDAQDTATQAEGLAKRALNDTMNLEYRVTQLHSDAGTLHRDSFELQRRIQDTEMQFQSKQDQANTDSTRVQTQINMAQQAEAKARRAKAAVKSTLEEIENLLKGLGSVEAVDTTKLTNLEIQFGKAKKSLGPDGELDRRMQELETTVNLQLTAMQSYETDIKKITADINNLEEIANALPEGCFNAGEIERP
uniref:Laminin subunit gamma-3 n=1 Tax=Eptatretus burgeri TaxID=7764 RepID=A0A8C4WXD5_EPTBU